MKEAGEIADVAESVAGGREARRGLLARLTIEVRLDSAPHLPDLLASEWVTLLGDGTSDAMESVRTNRALDERAQTERLIVGDLIPDDRLGGLLTIDLVNDELAGPPIADLLHVIRRPQQLICRELSSSSLGKEVKQQSFGNRLTHCSLLARW